MTPQIEKLLCEAVNENKAEKLCLIEDIIKQKRLLYGFGINEFLGSVLEPEKDFDHLYELSIESLELMMAELSAKCSRRARELAGFKDDEQTLKP